MRDTAIRITAQLPAKLLERAQEATGLGIVETLIAGLEAVQHGRSRSAWRALRDLFGHTGKQRLR